MSEGLAAAVTTLVVAWGLFHLAPPVVQAGQRWCSACWTWIRLWPLVRPLGYLRGQEPGVIAAPYLPDPDGWLEL